MLTADVVDLVDSVHSVRRQPRQSSQHRQSSQENHRRQAEWESNTAFGGRSPRTQIVSFNRTTAVLVRPEIGFAGPEVLNTVDLLNTHRMRNARKVGPKSDGRRGNRRPRIGLSLWDVVIALPWPIRRSNPQAERELRPLGIVWKLRYQDAWARSSRVSRLASARNEKSQNSVGVLARKFGFI